MSEPKNPDALAELFGEAKTLEEMTKQLLMFEAHLQIAVERAAALKAGLLELVKSMKELDTAAMGAAAAVGLVGDTARVARERVDPN